MQTSREVMTAQILSIHATTPLHDAYEMMRDHRVHQLPVVDNRDRVIGVLEDKNLDTEDINGVFKAADFVSPTHTVKEETPLRTVIFYMLERHLTYVLITGRKNNVIGIVTTEDLLWYLAHMLHEKESHKSFFSADRIQTIGEISRELSEMGI